MTALVGLANMLQMGPPPNPDAMLEMMDNPMFLSQMNEAMNNPAVVDMMMQSPMVSGGATEWFLLADT
jgi:ubiquilin